MEQHEDAQFDNYLQNRLAESLQITGDAGEHHLQLSDATADELSAPGVAPSKSEIKDNDREGDEEWKYIHEVQQSEKHEQQQQLLLAAETGNGFGPGLHSGDLVLGHGAAAGLNLDEEDVELIKNEGDLSTNSNTTTSTDEVVGQGQQVAEQLAEQDQLEQLKSHQEDEDEPSSVATTYGTSSLSENNPTPLDQEKVVLLSQPVAQELLASFDNKENFDCAGELEDNHSQLNPNAVAFVPSYGSQPSSPLRTVDDPILDLQPRQILLGGPLDDLVAESPRKGSARDNMDTIAVPDEREFDTEANKRPHELDQESDIFGTKNLDMQLLNGAESCESAALTNVLDHGPETSVDMDLSLDQLPAGADIMKQSIYAEHNASIEDILNSVQPLPMQTGDEKELLHVEEKEHISQSPSTEELQVQEEVQQEQHHQSFMSDADQDPMQASFYLEHTSKETLPSEHEPEPYPVKSSELFADQSLLLDTSAPQFSPESDSRVEKLELESQQAEIVDITPSPLSSTEEKHLVEDTKELVEKPKLDQESHFLESFSAGALPQMEEYAALNVASGSEAQNQEISPVPQGINPFAQPFTPAHLAEKHVEEESTPIHQEALAASLDELELHEELDVDQYFGKPNASSEHFALGDKEQKNDEISLKNFVSEEEHISVPKNEVVHTIGDFVSREDVATETKDFVPLNEQPGSSEEQVIFTAPEEQVIFTAPEEQVIFTAPEEQVMSAALSEQLQSDAPGEPLMSDAPGESLMSDDVEETLNVATQKLIISQIVEPLVNAVPETKKEDDSLVPVAEVLSVAAPVVIASKSNSAAKAGAIAGGARPKPVASANKTTTVSSTAGRPRTAPVANKATSTATKPSNSTQPTATTRKILSSNAASAAKPAPKLSSTRAVTAPVSKTSSGAKAVASKPTASGTALGTASGTRASARPLASTTARKPATSGVGSGTGVSSSARRPVPNTSGTGSAPSSAASNKARLAVTATAPAKPKALSPRSTTSTTSVRKVPSTNTTSISSRSPTKPTANGVGKSTVSNSANTTTTTTTITKTFTARPAPKFTHSVNSTISNGSTTRRQLVPSNSSATTTTNIRKSSPSKASPVKAAFKPLTPKPKETATTKPSPAGLKARKSTPLKGSTLSKEAGTTPRIETTSTNNGRINAEDAGKHNGNGLYDVEVVQPIHEQQFQDQVDPPQNGEAALLDI
ncbi:205 kDa microtubule-associated protein [Drosophila eugracilis]|uniref:205 kDa microtubule-associated protein n=1 Tax=Drosophila eugracilis TaxID=29029 RepID=UPI001BDAFAD0|nr:205 kDa microtubule-associated protein [Drosophila eugracilis]